MPEVICLLPKRKIRQNKFSDKCASSVVRFLCTFPKENHASRIMQPECNPFRPLCCYIGRTTSCTWQTWLVILRRSVTASSLPSLRSHLNNLAASSRFLPRSPPQCPRRFLQHPRRCVAASSLLPSGVSLDDIAASSLLPPWANDLAGSANISVLWRCALPASLGALPQQYRCFLPAPPTPPPPMIPQIPQISRCHVAASSLLPLGLSLNIIAASSLLPCFLPRPTPPMISQIPQIFRCHVAASSPLPSGFCLANIVASSQLPP